MSDSQVIERTGPLNIQHTVISAWKATQLDHAVMCPLREDIDSEEEPDGEGKPLSTEELRAKAAKAVSELDS